MARRSRLDKAIGSEGIRTVEVTLWVPDADRNGKPRHDQEEWKDKALRMFSEVFGKGATAMPRAEGAWVNPETQQLVMEHPVMVFCYVTEKQVGDPALMKRVGDFCREMGKTMYQGEVGLRVGGVFYFINTF